MSSDEQGHIIINCQQCEKRLITLEVGKAIFHHGMSVRCTFCESNMLFDRSRGGRAF